MFLIIIGNAQFIGEIDHDRIDQDFGRCDKHMPVYTVLFMAAFSVEESMVASTSHVTGGRGNPYYTRRLGTPFSLLSAHCIFLTCFSTCFIHLPVQVHRGGAVRASSQL